MHTGDGLKHRPKPLKTYLFIVILRYLKEWRDERTAFILWVKNDVYLVAYIPKRANAHTHTHAPPS